MPTALYASDDLGRALRGASGAWLRHATRRLCCLAFCLGWLAATTPAAGQIAGVWANNGEDKVAQEERRLADGGAHVTNSVWDGGRITLFGARNETVACSLVLEAPATDAVRGVSVALEELIGPKGQRLASSNSDLFDYVGRDIELFYVRYLPIKGVSVLAYHHYDERHVPHRFRRPHNARGRGRGGWTDRPDHDQSYPDIAVPLELHTPFEIAAGASQSIWIDVTIPKDAASGVYNGTIVVREAGTQTHRIPIELTVRDFTLPDLPTARTMLYVSEPNIHLRHLGERYPYDSQDADLRKRARRLTDRHFQLAHRHRISLITDHVPIERMPQSWVDRLSGALFTPERGYDGAGVGVGNNVFCIGAYGKWPWRDGDREAMWRNADRWVTWFDEQRFATPTDYFLYLIDESEDYDKIEEWSRWVDDNPGVGHRLPTLATLSAPAAEKHTPALDIPTATMTVGPTKVWEEAVAYFQSSPRHRFWMYNGFRPASGCFVTEEEGVALRQLAWCQFKMNVERWFAWEGTYYNNYQGGMGETNVFQQAHVFGGRSRVDASLGETGWNYNNGTGVLFYPGTDTVFPEENYGVPGPFASLRLKHWRRGLQDVEYLTLAARVDRPAVDRIVQRLIPRVLWEIGVSDPSDPTWVVTDISWPIDPDAWEAARAELADIIASGGDP